MHSQRIAGRCSIFGARVLILQVAQQGWFSSFTLYIGGPLEVVQYLVQVSLSPCLQK
jgi:hypothetical protein